MKQKCMLNKAQKMFGYGKLTSTPIIIPFTGLKITNVSNTAHQNNALLHFFSNLIKLIL